MNKIMVALITPFHDDFSIDFTSLKQIIHRLLKEGVDGFIVCGTTGEAPTLSEEEKLDVLSFVIEETKHCVEIWFGCGSNCTKKAIAMCKRAQMYDIDGVLLCAPYYNKPSQEGVYRHFKEVAHSITTKLMLYNIPSRCGVEIQTDTIVRLCNECLNITALKQASHAMDVIAVKKQFPDFKIYSGEDGFFDEAMDGGMDGLISVMGHMNLPRIKAFLNGKRMDNALRKQLNKEAALTFMEPSPACIKYMLSIKGECRNILRLPMCEISKQAETILNEYDKL